MASWYVIGGDAGSGRYKGPEGQDHSSLKGRIECHGQAGSMADSLRSVCMGQNPCCSVCKPVTDECYFLEENPYNTYASQKYWERNWYVALKKNGRPKLGPRTHIGQKAVFFLPRRLGDAAEWKQMAGHQEIV